MSKVQIDLGKKEFCVGLTFVALSRVKDLGGLMILNSSDYMSKIFKVVQSLMSAKQTLFHMRSEQNGPCTVYISLREAETAEEQSDDAWGEAPSDGGGSEA
ncbi:hypothetical protein K435DRAFT_848467 [Dendrothele bispora CBS 962.96]|uniref:Uncharacterized protein n=1 Tax=Dendrothele bispora (strain CBS 962.96) TaxID=1314807 RepID=A0A4S8MV23_DENBC|nr:hypothetical protein K435DRAFT_848467 [Dendrothele bispora CBS 962.96]